MTDLAIDALSTTIQPEAIRNAGYVAVLNYLRDVTTSVVAGYHQAGLGFGSIFETRANESLGGAAAGTRDGQTSAAQMRALGQPAGTVHAVNLTDFAATSTELSTIEAYWNAYKAQTAAWHVIPYGTGWLLKAMNVPGWQNAMDDNGASGSVVVAQAVLYQRVTPTRQLPGGSYDEDVILTSLPWWGPTHPAPAPTPTTEVPFVNLTQTSITLGTNAAGDGWTPKPLPFPASTVTGAWINPSNLALGQPPTSGDVKTADWDGGTYVQITGGNANSQMTVIVAHVTD